jgi:hypothetical protein
VRVPSPNGNRQAIVFERNCGAASGFVYHVSIVDGDVDVPSGVGNTFRMRDTIVASQRLINTLGLHWQGENNLVIRYDARAVVIRRDDHVGSVSVNFEQVDVH